MSLYALKNNQSLSKEQIHKKHLFITKFHYLMYELGLLNKFSDTYKLNILEITNYGYYAHIYLVSGLSFNELKSNKDVIEQNLMCIWNMNVAQFQEYAEVQIVINPVNKDIEYNNPNIKPWETYLGLSFSHEILKNNNNDNCMFLLAGAVGSGKTRFLYTVLLSWILGCSPEDVWIYISDIAKNEYNQFRNVLHVKGYAEELDELMAMMGSIQREFNRRKHLISKYREQGIATNIDEYNKINPNNKLAYCYILIDEFSVIIPDKTDSKDESDQKQFILDTIKRLEKLGRSLGIFCFIATQKTTRDEIPSIIKNMSAVRISFRANDAISSEVIMGDNSAMGLSERIAVYSQNGGSIQNYLFTPKITVERLNNLLQPFIKDKNIPLKRQRGLRNVSTIYSLPSGLTYQERIEYIRSLTATISSSREDDFNDY